MKTIINILIAVLALSLTNCSKDNKKGTDVDERVKIVYENISGEDLLNSATQNYYPANGIHVYNVKNKIKTERFYGNLDNPRMWEIVETTPDRYSLWVDIETETTLLELNKDVVDTVKCIIDKSDGNTTIRKVWYNGIVKWDNISVPRIFTIVK